MARVRRGAWLWLAALTLVGCGDASEQGSLVLLDAPVAIETGATFPDLRVELHDLDGAIIRRSATVTLTAGGTGELRGPTALEMTDGVAVASGLAYRGCGTIRLAAAADRPGIAPAVSGGIAVAPRLVASEEPPVLFPPGAVPPIAVATVEAGGAPFDPGDVMLEIAAGGEVALDVESVTDATLSAGEARFDMLSVSGAGELALTVSASPGQACSPAPLSLGPYVVAGGDRGTVPVFLEGARVGVSYMDALPGGAERYVGGPPPAGLALDADTGVITGVPTEPGPGRFDVVALDPAGEGLRLQVQLPVFPPTDADDPPPIEPSEQGPYAPASMVLSIPSVLTSRGTFTSIAVRVAYPSDGAAVAAGRFPVIAFHHAAHSPPDIYDDYTELHDHWASHGFIVASVDSSANVRMEPQSFQNLLDMSAFQLAAAELLRTADADPASPFFGRVDVDRVIVSGHSRGGGASLVSLWQDPSLYGAICFEQVSPLQTPGQDFSRPEMNADRPFPLRPVLIFVADGDADEPWPLPDTAREQASGPTVVVTIHGANHEDTYDEGTEGGLSSVSAISYEERHAIDQHYSTAFLRRFVGAEVAFDGALFGRQALSSSLSSRGVTVQSFRFMNTALPVDDFQDGDPTENLLGGPTTGTGLATDEIDHPYADGLAAAGRGDVRSDRIAVWSRSRHVVWDSAGAELAFAAAPGDALDLRDRRLLALRVMRQCPPPDAPCPHQDLSFRVVLAGAGSEAAVDVADGMGALGIRGRHFGTTLLPLDAFPGVDLAAVTAVSVRFDTPGFDAGDVWLDDLRFE